MRACYCYRPYAIGPQIRLCRIKQNIHLILYPQGSSLGKRDSAPINV